MEKVAPNNFRARLPWELHGYAAKPHTHAGAMGKVHENYLGVLFFHGFWLCVAWVRPKLYLTHAPHYSTFEKIIVCAKFAKKVLNHVSLQAKLHLALYVQKRYLVF